jgi:hypothetical protein
MTGKSSWGHGPTTSSPKALPFSTKPRALSDLRLKKHPSGDGFGDVGSATGFRFGLKMEGLSIPAVGQGVVGNGAMEGALDMEGLGVAVVGSVGEGVLGSGVVGLIVGALVGMAVTGIVTVGCGVGSVKSRQMEDDELSSKQVHSVALFAAPVN